MDVNKDLVRADDLYFYVTSANTVVAFATSCSLQVDGETIDSSNKMSCRWNANLAGKNSYSVSVDALYTQNTGLTSFDKLMEMMVSGAAIDWAIGVAQAYTGTCESNTFALDTSKVYYSGKGLITSLSLNGGNNEVASCSMTVTGSGGITIHKP